MKTNRERFIAFFIDDNGSLCLVGDFRFPHLFKTREKALEAAVFNHRPGIVVQVTIPKGVKI